MNGPPDRPLPLVHFVGFRDDRYWNAVRVFGRPDFIHPSWDRHAIGDIDAGDIVIHATAGTADAPPLSMSARAARRRGAVAEPRPAADV
ncbi:hypothetical protein EYB45_09440 [Erythrobacteraceae bacterium CFH 75059]|uniref:hypothetical protein n=1 Tax=Qipengyuania thermophila TaxID=2509361 RepID=UPI0010210CAE|nr:hypothetical protein [Qipengyuania thermophila]TCD04125.1 hypothetical protein EYB45_09440 [Erythrobacteraceae bacterium CFH 75059]